MNHPKDLLIASLFHSGLVTPLQAVNRGRLTVLNYHRIQPGGPPAWSHLFQPNISATPEQFAEQLHYLKRFYTPITLDLLLAWLHGTERLPDFPALLTFDDGYRDNLVHAAPILQQTGWPAVIFLTSGHIDKPGDFYWDVSALCFARTPRPAADLPLLGPRTWDDASGRTSVLREWTEALKRVDESEKRNFMSRLPAILDVELPTEAFANSMMTWEEVRTLQAQGIAFGAHTVSHPILTRIPLDQAEHEMAASKQHIEQELGQPVRAFAYPNGQASDTTPKIQALARKVGFEAAFTLIAGPSPLEEVKANPFAIRRIFIGHKDTLPRFAVKLTGGLRLLRTAQSY